MSDITEKKPKRLSMAGMIYEANEVLSWAMDPGLGGLHPDLFGPGLLGLGFISIIEAGFLFSGNVGTGIIFARKKDGSWSPPSAIGLTGVGFGFMMGASKKNIVYLIYDPETIKSMAGDVGFKFGAQTEASIVNWGRTAEISNHISNKGLGANIALSYSKGLFGGISVEGALCNPRTNINRKFYGRDASPKQILFEDAVKVPEGTLWPEILDKLDKMCSGKGIYEITDAEKKKSEEARKKADKEDEEQLKDEKVEKVEI